MAPIRARTDLWPAFAVELGQERRLRPGPRRLVPFRPAAPGVLGDGLPADRSDQLARVARKPDPGDRARAARRGRRRAVDPGTLLVGRPPDEPDTGRPHGQGPAL